MAHNLPRTIKPSEMQLGDVVSPTRSDGSRGPWDSCVVEQIGPKEVTLFRPYGTTADFSMSGGAPDTLAVICYTGLEQYSIPRDSTSDWTLHTRQELK